MNLSTDILAHEYEHALRDYLDAAAETALSRAYEVGRKALSGGLGVVQMAMMHHESLAHLLGELPQRRTAVQTARDAALVEAESLSVFEMALRGYRQSNDTLMRLNKDLKEQAAELAAANDQLRSLSDELDRRARELERSNGELSQFAYAISHDLRAPLRSVAAFLQLLVSDHSRELQPEAVDLVDRAVNSARRMQAMIDDLLEYSRSTQNPGRLTPVDMAVIVQQALDNLQLSIRESGGQVMIGPMPTVMGNASQLMRLFQNLIGNALKFSRPGVSPQVRVSAEAHDWEWVFSIADNGIGIAAADSKQLFQIFHRLHRSEDYPGTGIGLAICKRIVEQHGGAIWIDSEVGQGSTFHFTLRAVASTAGNGAPKSTAE